MHILWDEWIEKYRTELLLAVGGIILIGIGVFWWKGGFAPADQVQILSATDTATSAAEIFVDIQGSVANPGVYTLPMGSRIDDAIKLAGGLNASADTNWVQLHLNRAEKITDGMKLFIPAVSKTNENEANAVNSIPAEVISTGININGASQTELEALPGIGPVTAKKIIDNRPYGTIDQLLSKKVVSQKVFDQIKEQIETW